MERYDEKSTEEGGALIRELEKRLAELGGQNLEFRLALEKLTAELNRLSRLHELAPFGHFTLDRAGDITESNKTGALLLGVDRSELIYRRFLGFVTEGTRPALNSLLIKTFAGGPSEPCEVGLIRRNGETIFVRIQAVLDKVSQECRLAVMDITDRIRKEDVLRQNEEKYRRIVETANEAIVVTDAESKVTFFNLRASEMLGYQPEEICGREFDDFLFEEERPIRSTKRENRGKLLAERYARRIKCKDGGWVWAVVTATPILDGEGRAQGSFTMVTDVLSRKQADDRLMDEPKEV